MSIEPSSNTSTTPSDDISLDSYTYDIIILGTSLIPCILSSAFSKNNYKVLHLDRNEIYGNNHSSMNIEDMRNWVEEHKQVGVESNVKKERKEKLNQMKYKIDMNSCYSNAYIYDDEYIKLINKKKSETIKPSLENISNDDNRKCNENTAKRITESDSSDYNFNHRDHIIDISPHLLYSRGDMVELLIRTQTSNYLSFISLENVFIYLDKNFEKVPCSKSDVFNSNLSMIEKRALMKFVHLIMSDTANPHTYDAVNTESINKYIDMPFSEFLKSQKLSSKLSVIVTYALGLLLEVIRDQTSLDISAYSNDNILTADIIAKISLFLKSMGRYAASSFLIAKYGIADVPQAFARLSAVYGGSFILRFMPKEIIITDDENWKHLNPPIADEKSKLKFNTSESDIAFRGITLQNGQIVSAKHLICDADYVSEWTSPGSKSLFRTVIISSSGLSKSTGLFIIPPGLVINPVQIIQHDESTDICKGTFMLYLTTIFTEHAKSDIDNVIKYFFENSTDATPPKLLYRAEWAQNQRIATAPKNVWVCSDPSFEVDIDSVKSAESIFKSIVPEEIFLPLIPQNDSGFDVLDNLTLNEEKIEKIDSPMIVPICRPSSPAVTEILKIDEIATLVDRSLNVSPKGNKSPKIDSDTEHDHLVEAREFKQEENVNERTYDSNLPLISHMLSQPHLRPISFSLYADTSSVGNPSSVPTSPTSMASHTSYMSTVATTTNRNVNLRDTIRENAASATSISSIAERIEELDGSNISSDLSF